MVIEPIDLLVNLKLLIMHSEEASVKENVNKWALCTCVCFLTILWQGKVTREGGNFIGVA